MTDQEAAVWTDEQREAFFVALPLLEEGDTTAARMAFRSAYERLVRDARAADRPAKWQVSAGTDRDHTRHVIEQAVRTGRLTKQHADVLLPAPSRAEGPIAAMMQGKPEAVIRLAAVNGTTLDDEHYRQAAKRNLPALLAAIKPKTDK